jgi:serine/threonine protein kinase
VGEVFGGRYELVDVLAAGGMGTVWRVWDHRDHAYRAAKVLRQADSDSLLRFMRETTWHVEHPHVVAPTGWIGEDDRVLFTMPLVAGGSVATLLGDFGPLPLGWSIELTRQALLGLGEVHGVGLVHRDIKPANLLLDATGAARPHLMLSDFGAAAKVGSPRLTQVDTVIGTPGYMAPEQFRGADPAPAQDVYAVGVVLLQMLTGQPPASDGSLPSYDGPLAEVVTRLTCPDPGRRPATATEALALLEAVPGSDDLGLGLDRQDAVEVFDHVPALPEGWGPTGPSRGTRALGQPAASAPTRLLPQPQHDTLPPQRREAGVPRLTWVLLAVGVLLLALALALAL